MFHPVTSSIKSTITFFLSWIPINAIFSLVLCYSVDLQPLQCISIGFVSGYIFAICSLSLWYIVKYGGLYSKGELTTKIVNHLLLAAIFIVLWHFITSFTIMYDTISDNPQELKKFTVIKISFGMFFYFFTLLVFRMKKMNDDIQETKVNEEKLVTLVKETELKALKNQINPHFLFNSLNSLSNLVSYDTKAARDTIFKLSDYLRYTLKQKEDQLIDLKTELQKTRQYLEIEKTRFAEKLLLEEIIDEELLKIQVPILILQPIYENAIKYGVYESLEPVTIKTEVKRVGRDVIISIGNPYDKSAIPRKGTGIGIKNVHTRLHLIYNNPELLSLNDTGEYFEVQIKIPANKN